MLHTNKTNRYKTFFNYFILLVALACSDRMPLLAQQNASYIFQRLTQSDGLLHTTVRSIVQDAKGYLWILTPNGLQRYDGSRFVNYPYDVTNTGGIIDPRTAALFSDKKNNCLWILDKQIQKFDLQKNKFSLFNAKDLAQSSEFQFDQYTDSLHHTWFVGYFGILCDHPFKNMMSSYLSASSLLTNNSSVFFTDTEKGQTWMADYWNGLLLFDKRTKKVYTHNYNPIHDPLLQAMDKTTIIGIVKDGEHNIWINTNSPAFYRYDTRNGKLATYSLNDLAALKKINHSNTTLFAVNLFEDNHHTLWIGTENGGLLQYNREKDSFISIFDEEQSQQGLEYNYGIACIFQDRDENIWLGTDKGISIFNPYRQYFKVVRHEENNPASLPKNEIQSFIQTKNGDILVGSWGGGITLYDSTLTFKKNIRFTGRFEYNMLWSFVQNDDGNIWAGCQHGYIHIYHPLNEEIQTIHPPELHNFTIHCMAKDKEGNIWFGLHDGKIAEWSKRENKFYAYNDSLAGISQNFSTVNNIFFDSKLRCWVSTEWGLKQLDTKRRLYSAVYLPDGKNRHSISATNIQGIEEYNDSTLLIGTLHGSVSLFHTNSKTFSRLETADELSSNSVYAIKKDGQKSFWLTTDFGVYKYIPENKKIIRYKIEPNVLNSAFKSTNFYTLQNGTWITHTSTEIIGFTPARMGLQTSKTPKVEIAGFKIFDEPVFIDSLLAADKPIHLNYDQNFLTIEFSLLNFSNQEQANYRYKLSGVNKDWVNTNTKQFASYTNLQPGEYTFFVKADNGNETSSVSSLRIIILPPFWKTWWFTVFVALMLTAFAYVFLRRRINTIRREAELKHKIAESEMQALRAQMNPHFIFNCLNAIDNLIQTNQKDKATTYLARFAKLIRSVLDSSKNNLVPFYKDFEALQLYLQLEQFRCNNKFTYELSAESDLLNGDYKVPPLIVQPFAENAIHHGLLNKQKGGRKLVIKASLSDNFICYKITDDGVGRTQAMHIKTLNKPEHVSYGIEITKERIRLHNRNENEDSVVINDIENDGVPAGTEVDVCIKIDPSNL